MGEEGDPDIARSFSSGGLYDVLELILDKGLVVDVELVHKDGLEANAVFRKTDEDLRRADKVLKPASPGEGDGRLLDVAHYEVLRDV